MVKKRYGNYGYIKSFHSFAFHMSENEIKNRIKEVAHKMVMQYGIRSVSMDDMAGELGMSKKTIYQYFKDKDELVEAIVTDVVSKNQATCMSDRSGAENAVHEVFLGMEMVVAMFRTMNPSILFDLQKYHPSAFRLFLHHKNEFVYNIMKKNIDRGISEGLYRADIKVEILSRFRVDSMMLPFNPEFLSKTNSSLMEVEEQVIIHWVYGLVTEKGYKMVQKYFKESSK